MSVLVEINPSVVMGSSGLVSGSIRMKWVQVARGFTGKLWEGCVSSANMLAGNPSFCHHVTSPLACRTRRVEFFFPSVNQRKRHRLRACRMSASVTNQRLRLYGQTRRAVMCSPRPT